MNTKVDFLTTRNNSDTSLYSCMVGYGALSTDLNYMYYQVDVYLPIPATTGVLGYSRLTKHRYKKITSNTFISVQP